MNVERLCGWHGLELEVRANGGYLTLGYWLITCSWRWV